MVISSYAVAPTIVLAKTRLIEEMKTSTILPSLDSGESVGGTTGGAPATFMAIYFS